MITKTFLSRFVFIVGFCLMLTPAVFPQAPPKSKKLEQKSKSKPDISTEADKKPLVNIVPPYEDALLKLAETMGSLSFLDDLCQETSSTTQSDVWRKKLQQLLDIEGTSVSRKEMFIGSFNRGFNGYGDIYRVCTDNARIAKDRLLDEGAILTRDITTRFGN